MNIVAITIEEQSLGKYINGFIFTRPEEAIEFYEAIHRALGYQLYCQKLLEINLPFNVNLSNLVGDVMNGRCVINPVDFADGKEGEEETKMIGSML